MSNMENSALTSNDDDAVYAQVPEDFPYPELSGAVPGAQTKFLATKYKGRFYSPGCTPPELFERWQVCEDLAAQLAAKSISSKAGHRAHMSELEILEQYLPRLIAQRWTSEAEARFIIRRVAEITGWPAPSSAMGKGATPTHSEGK